MTKLPLELIKHDQWVQRPTKQNDQSVWDKSNWGKYQSGEREWFVLTPNLELVVAVIYNVDGSPPIYRWGYGKFHNNVKLIKLSKTLGMIITCETCVPVLKHDNWEPFVSFQTILDIFCKNEEGHRRVESGETLIEEISQDVGIPI